jgi:hypothetical protein
MERKVLLAVLLFAMMATMALAQTVCPIPQPGDRVRITPTSTVVAVECPRGYVDGQNIIEHKMYNVWDNNRTVTMWMRPYPPGSMTELVFILEKGYGNPDGAASLDAQIRGPGGNRDIKLRRMGPGKYCGYGDFEPGWNKIHAWLTAPSQSELVVFDFWAGSLSEKPRMVNWVCPRCRVTTVSTSCPVCLP